MNNEKRNELKKVLRAILIAEKSSGMPLRVLERKYAEMDGRQMPLFGYPDTAALLNSLTDTVYTNMVRGQLTVYPVETKETMHMFQLVKNTNERRARTRAPRNNARKLDKTIITGRLTGNGNNGRRANRNGPQPNSIGKSKDGRSYLHQRQNGTSHQATLTTTATTTSIQSDRKQSNDYANHANNAEAEAQESADIDDEHVVKLDDSDDGSDYDYAELKCNDKAKANIARFLLTFEEEDIHLEGLPTLELDKIFESGRGVRLFFSQVHSPFKFWFQLNDHLEAIDSLMDRLNDFYRGNQSNLAQTAIPDEFLEIGMTCAALFNAEWHRGKIVDIFEETLQVFYVDYGTVSEIYKADTRFLDKQFTTQPMYAIRGCLDRVRPSAGIWTYRAMEEFSERLKEFFLVPILGKPTLLNLPEQTVYLDLIDTTERIDVDIGKWTILRNHAYATRKLLFNYKQRHYNEVYPSFERLENGSYPSFADIQSMMQQGIDYLAVELTIVVPEMYGYQTIE